MRDVKRRSHTLAPWEIIADQCPFATVSFTLVAKGDNTLCEPGNKRNNTYSISGDVNGKKKAMSENDKVDLATCQGGTEARPPISP